MRERERDRERRRKGERKGERERERVENKNVDSKIVKWCWSIGCKINKRTSNLDKSQSL